MRMATTVRVTESTRARAASIASASGTTIGAVIDRALDTYEEKLFWMQTQQALTQRGDVAEDPAWELSVRDGLDSE